MKKPKLLFLELYDKIDVDFQMEGEGVEQNSEI
jgi:hypothetical protein